VADSGEVMIMRVMCGIVMVCGSILGIVVSFLGQITLNSEVSLLNGVQLSLGLVIFFILTCLGGIYIIANSD
jgi:uncharacterized membrane protein